ncbi:hypothetical protein LCGC14_1564260 [marine sediment metagenome]|uniref:Uncharacterized protein n=1 Tax=marine sediment metagenome TaxID=412755 RepID=A0A0F9LM47_9ZZZZ
MAQFVTVDGTSGEFIDTPDSAASSPTGDFAIAVKVAMIDWTPGSTDFFLSKLDDAPERAYELGVNNTGFPFSRVSTDGTALENDTGDAVWGASDGATLWVGVEYDFGTGIRYLTSSDGVSWAQVGSTETLTAASINDGNELLTVGAKAGNSNQMAGNFYEAKIYSSADLTSGTVVVHLNADDFTLGEGNNDTAVSSATGETWTLHGDNTVIGADAGLGGMLLLGVG